MRPFYRIRYDSGGECICVTPRLFVNILVLAMAIASFLGFAWMLFLSGIMFGDNGDLYFSFQTIRSYTHILYAVFYMAAFILLVMQLPLPRLILNHNDNTIVLKSAGEYLWAFPWNGLQAARVCPVHVAFLRCNLYVLQVDIKGDECISVFFSFSNTSLLYWKEKIDNLLAIKDSAQDCEHNVDAFMFKGCPITEYSWKPYLYCCQIDRDGHGIACLRYYPKYANCRTASYIAAVLAIAVLLALPVIVSENNLFYITIPLSIVSLIALALGRRYASRIDQVTIDANRNMLCVNTKNVSDQVPLSPEWRLHFRQKFEGGLGNYECNIVFSDRGKECSLNLLVGEDAESLIGDVRSILEATGAKIDIAPGVSRDICHQFGGWPG